MKTLFNALALGLTLLNTQLVVQVGRAQDGNENKELKYVSVERAYSSLRFNRPVHITGAGDGSNRLFVVEQDGMVHWFDQSKEQPQAKVFLDIRDKISRRGNEEGLIGFAFHPKFSENGLVYCHYSSDSIRTGKGENASNVLAVYRLDSNGASVDPKSEEILLTVEQPYNNHNGGAIAFGKD